MFYSLPQSHFIQKTLIESKIHKEVQYGYGEKGFNVCIQAWQT